jgi:hypothetical protein
MQLSIGVTNNLSNDLTFIAHFWYFVDLFGDLPGKFNPFPQPKRQPY